MSSTLEGFEAPSISLDGVINLVAFPQRASGALRERPAQIIKLLLDERETLLVRLVTSRSVEEFMRLRELLLNRYLHLVRSISDCVTAAVDDDSLTYELAQDSLRGLERNFNEKGVEHLGAAASKEALFSLATLIKVYRLLPEIKSKKPPSRRLKHDRELAKSFSFTFLWAHIHLDCLGTALDRQVQLAPEVLEAILDGMRRSVMAYSCLRQGLQLRGGASPSHKTKPPEWDDEDQVLLEESARELETVSID